MIKLLSLNGNPTDAPSFYRSTGVFARLKEVEVINSITVDWATLLPVDVVFIPRPYTTNMVGVMEYIKKCKKPTWIDLDDDHFNLPETNPAYGQLGNPSAIACTIACINLADIVTVSTESIKQSILEHCPGADVRIIPNAVDDELFDLTHSDHERNKTILIRGGGSHEADIEAYKEPILQLINDYPEYKWAFMGYCPSWIINSGISDDRLLIFPYFDTMKYFETLMELKPAMMIVPLEDNLFNRGKSNISWIEGTITGAAVIAPSLPEFIVTGCLPVDNHDIFIDRVELLIKESRCVSIMNYISLQHVPRLSDTNKLRKEIIEELVAKKLKYQVGRKDLSPATDKQFFEHCLTHGHIQEHEGYRNIHSNLAKWIKTNIDPKEAVEFGSGPGYLTKCLIDLGVDTIGLELNPYFVEYFNSKYPELKENIYQCDFVNDPVEFDGMLDLGISIEVFEHIKMEESKWDEFIKHLSTKFKHFYFSSTPFREKPSWDEYWGHINIRTTTNWIKLFEKNGWVLEQKPKVITGWDLLFKSKEI